MARKLPHVAVLDQIAYELNQLSMAQTMKDVDHFYVIIRTLFELLDAEGMNIVEKHVPEVMARLEVLRSACTDTSVLRLINNLIHNLGKEFAEVLKTQAQTAAMPK